MRWWILFVFTAAVPQGESEKCSSVHYRQDEFFIMSCKLEQTDVEQDGSSCDTTGMFPKIHILDSKQGKIAVEFRLLNKSCNFTEYIFVLSETQKPKYSCANYSSKKHVHIVQKDEVRSCGKNFNVTFENVYKGNYTLQYSSKNHTETYLNKKKLQLNTDYEKKEICFSSINPMTPGASEGDKITFKITGYSQINMAEFSTIKNPAKKCTNFADGYRWYTTRDVNKTFMCKTDKSHERVSTRWVECSEDDEGGIVCTLHNFSAGNYCFAVVKKSSKGGYCCKQYKYFNISEKLSIQPLKAWSQTSNMYIGLTAALVFLLIVSVVVLIVLWTRRREIRIPGPYFRENRLLAQTSQILLLYARDCEPFMKTMVAFRELLKKIPDCKLYDCFDTNLVEDICRSKVDWMQRHISLNDMKIVVVESACVLQHQEALLHHNKVCYNQPTWLDDLFLYGLKAMINDVERNTYQSVFVIRIDGFTEEKEFLNNLSPYTRYIIPQHLEILLADLHLRGKLDVCDEAINENLQNLQQDITNLANYKKHNPHYLKKLLST